MRTFTMLVMDRTYSGCGGVILGIGMAVFCAVSSTAQAQGTTAVAGGAFQDAPFDAQSSQFTAEFDATTTGAGNARVGLSDDSRLASVLVGFGPNGNIDALNGAAFSAAAAIPYVSGLTYHFREDVDVVNHIRSMAVRLPAEACFTVIAGYIS